jgi:hypothetical protein
MVLHRYRWYRTPYYDEAEYDTGDFYEACFVAMVDGVHPEVRQWTVLLK